MSSGQLILTLPAPPSDGQRNCNDENRPEFESAPTTTVATQTRAIGIIHPPPNIRSIVDKTSRYFAKYGPQFEKTISVNNSGNAKFNFLNPSDPYHAYYQHRLLSEAQNPSSDSVTDSAPPESAPIAAVKDTLPMSKVLEPPEAEQFTVRIPEGIVITGEELDIIKLTAQFVAINRDSFLSGLSSREITNPQFNFLKPTHSMHIFFNSLVAAYSKVLAMVPPPKCLTDKLRDSVSDMTRVLERCLHRLEWERSQELARQKAEDEVEKERLQMAAIDWHDFVVVETIEYFADDEDEDLPPPMTLEEVIQSRSRMSTTGVEEDFVVDIDPGKEVEMEMDKEELQLVEEGMRAENEAPMRIVPDFQRPEYRRQPAEDRAGKLVVSPITCELIPINEISEHIRISLIDPKYKEQKERMFEKIRDTTLAPDDEIAKNIVRLARTRPDIFGTTEEEVSNAVKAGIEIEQKKDDQVIWDGHSGSIGRIATQALSQTAGGDPNEANMDTRNYPGPKQAIPSIPRPLPPMNPLPVQQHLAVNRPLMPLNIGHVPPPPPSRLQFTHFGVQMPMNLVPPRPQIIPPPPPPEEAPPLPEEPEPKRQKLDESALIPEEQFLAQYPGPALISVSVPNFGEGSVMKGQVLKITMQSLSETITALKERIAGEIQVPANKQKLMSGKAGFLKDNMSLAHCNVAPGDTLSLSLRERGGRKK